MSNNTPQWLPLAEDQNERATWDHQLKLQMGGDVRAAIAYWLRMFATMRPGGSYAEVCKIMANEVMRLDRSDRAQREPLSDEQMLACVRSIGTPAPMGLTRDRGPYEVTEPTRFLVRLVRAIEAAHGITLPAAAAPAQGEQQAPQEQPR